MTTKTGNDQGPLATVEPERAQRIGRALRRGQAMNNPEDAALAVAAAAHLPAMWHKNRWWIWLVDAGFIAFVAAAPLLALYTWKLTLVTLAIAVPGAFVTFVLLPHWSRRSAEAERLNRALLETFGREGSEALRRVEAA